MREGNRKNFWSYLLKNFSVVLFEYLPLQMGLDGMRLCEWVLSGA